MTELEELEALAKKLGIESADLAEYVRDDIAKEAESINSRGLLSQLAFLFAGVPQSIAKARLRRIAGVPSIGDLGGE